ncbi:uncharacterized protein LOC108631196 [Ceratina calcarata]|nr:uncharacterized protein LOC108631196 [Ceratina calcarata]
MPHDQREPVPVILDSLMNWSLQHGASVLIGADANACHVLWGSTVTNERGTRLLDFLNENGLTWLNRGSVPTFSTAYREETLDVTIVSLGICSAFSDWRVLDDTSMSDHRYVSFALTVGGIPAMRIVSEKRSLNAERYLDVLQKRLAESPREYGTPAQIDAYVEHVTDAITEAAREAITRKEKGFNAGLPWWGPKLKALNDRCRRLTKNHVCVGSHTHGDGST